MDKEKSGVTCAPPVREGTHVGMQYGMTYGMGTSSFGVAYTGTSSSTYRNVVRRWGDDPAAYGATLMAPS